ncbi:MAG: T9SS type A sorting domain-containing protein [Bacteroidota bacterium]
MKRYFTLIFTLLTCCLYLHQADAQTINKTIEHDGLIRQYTVYLPATYNPNVASPVVFNLHGIGSSSGEQVLYSGFSTVADTAGCIVVFPEGTVDTMLWGEIINHWNSYFSPDVDDVGFINLLIDQMFTDYNIDLSRIYATGMSNGGFMSYRLACELSDRIAAIASVTGAMTLTAEDNCNPDRPVPVMQIHGTNDQVVFFDGQMDFTRPIPEIVDAWVARNGCNTIADTVALPDIDPTDNSTVRLLSYSDCDDETEVVFYIVDNGGHTWPGTFPILMLGNTNQDFSASATVWDFFNKHTHPNPSPGVIITTNTKELAPPLEVAIAPNPFQNELRLDFPTALPRQLRLFDTSGRLVLTKRDIRENTLRLNTATLTQGVYLLELQTDQGVISYKVVKE